MACMLSGVTRSFSLPLGERPVTLGTGETLQRGTLPEYPPPKPTRSSSRTSPRLPRSDDKIVTQNGTADPPQQSRPIDPTQLPDIKVTDSLGTVHSTSLEGSEKVAKMPSAPAEAPSEAAVPKQETAQVSSEPVPAAMVVEATKENTKETSSDRKPDHNEQVGANEIKEKEDEVRKEEEREDKKVEEGKEETTKHEVEEPSGGGGSSSFDFMFVASQVLDEQRKEEKKKESEEEKEKEMKEKEEEEKRKKEEERKREEEKKREEKEREEKEREERKGESVKQEEEPTGSSGFDFMFEASRVLGEQN